MRIAILICWKFLESTLSSAVARPFAHSPCLLLRLFTYPPAEELLPLETALLFPSGFLYHPGNMSIIHCNKALQSTIGFLFVPVQILPRAA